MEIRFARTVILVNRFGYPSNPDALSGRLRIVQQKLCCALPFQLFWACFRFRSAGLTA
jgi:hypothetical protein